MEQAFSLNVPAGWTVRGGLFRMGYSDERAMIDMKSPDGAINIRLGDVAIPSYAVPTPTHAHEGEIYDLGLQAHMVVARYRTGPEFAVLYSHSRVASVCHNPQPGDANLDFAVPDVVPLDASVKQSSSGEISYRCVSDAGPRTVVVYAKTAAYGNLWEVHTLVSIVAAPERLDQARAIALESVKSMHLNPQWIEYQKRMDAEGLEYQRARQQQRRREIAQQVQQFEAKMQAMQQQVNAFERHQQASAQQFQQFDNVINGVTPTVDPLTGEARDVWTGPKANYWKNGLGTVVNSNDQPGPGWRQLQVPQN